MFLSIAISLSLHTPPRFILLGLLFLQNLGHDLRSQLQWEFHIPSKLVRLACFRIGNPQKIDASHQALGRTNQVTNAFLILRVFLNEELHRFIGKNEVAVLEGQTFLKLLPDVVLQNDLLVRRLLPRTGDHLETIAKDRMNLGLIVEREDEQALGQIEVNAGKLTIVELRVLRTIRQVNQEIHDFLATIRAGDLVELIKLQHRIHTAGLRESLHNSTAHRAFLGEGMTHKGCRIRGTAEREERKRTLQNIRNSVACEAGLTDTHGSLESDDIAYGVWVGNPLGQNLHDLSLGREHSVHSLVHLDTSRREELRTGLLPIGHLDRQRNLLAERNLEELIHPILELEVLTAFHLLKCIQLLDDAGLDGIRDGHLQNTELQRDISRLDELSQRLHLFVQGTTLGLGKTLLVIFFVFIEFEMRN